MYGWGLRLGSSLGFTMDVFEEELGYAIGCEVVIDEDELDNLLFDLLCLLALSKTQT